MPLRGLADFIPFLSTENIGELDYNNWPTIVEAIQDNLESPPEQEFITNALEHLKVRNYRLALIESIICLEIVLTQYLKAFFSINKQIPEKRINNFLNPNLGLNARISVLLNLCLDERDIESVNFTNILRAINRRNHIIHKTGNLARLS